MLNYVKTIIDLVLCDYVSYNGMELINWSSESWATGVCLIVVFIGVFILQMLTMSTLFDIYHYNIHMYGKLERKAE